MMAALDLLGRKWTLRILWELRDSRLTFRELQKVCGHLSPTILNKRLSELRKAKIIDLSESQNGYGLSNRGRALLLSLAPLNEWSKKWASALENEKNLSA